jgi:hypothetical protein
MSTVFAHDVISIQTCLVSQWVSEYTIPLRNKNKLTIVQSSGYDSRFGTQLREAPGSSPGWDHSFAPISLSIASILRVQ